MINHHKRSRLNENERDFKFCEDSSCKGKELIVVKFNNRACTNCGRIYKQAFTCDPYYNFSQLQGNTSYQKTISRQEVLGGDDAIQHYVKKNNRQESFLEGTDKRVMRSLLKADQRSLTKEEKKKKQILVLVDDILEAIPEFHRGHPRLGAIKRNCISILTTILQVWRECNESPRLERKKKFSLPKHHIVIACCVSILGIKNFHLGILQETVVKASHDLDPQCSNSKVSRFLKMLEALPGVFNFYTSNKEIYENITAFFCNRFNFIPFHVGQEAKRLSDQAIFNVVFAGRSPKVAVSAAIHHVLFGCPLLKTKICRKKHEYEELIKGLKDFEMLDRICDNFEIKLKTLLLSSEEIGKSHELCHG